VLRTERGDPEVQFAAVPIELFCETPVPVTVKVGPFVALVLIALVSVPLSTHLINWREPVEATLASDIGQLYPNATFDICFKHLESL
jgi:hypothetical protein